MNDTELDQLLNTWEVPETPAWLRASVVSALPWTPPRRSFGRRLRWITALTLGAGAVAVGTSMFSTGTIGSDSGTWDNQIHVRRTRIVSPTIAKLKWQFRSGRSTGWRWESGRLVGSVYLTDPWNHTQHGYTWHAEPMGGGQYRFTVLPLDGLLVAPGNRNVPVPAPPPFVVRAGSTFDIALYAAGEERVYDHYELSGKALDVLPQEPQSSTETLTLTAPVLYINGAFAADSGGVVEASGAMVAVNVPGRGHFILMLDPRGDERYQKTARLTGKAAEFEHDGVRYRIECKAPLAPGGDRPVWLRVDPPSGGNRPEFSSGAPR